MAYGTVKVDNITFDQGGADQNVTASGIYRAITSGVTVSGTIAGAVLIGTTTISGTTVTGTTANFASGVFTTQVSGATVTGTQSSFTSGNFVTLSGTTATFTSGVIASGTAAAPSLSILGDANTGIYSPGADQVAISTNGTGRLFVSNTSAILPSGSLLVGQNTNPSNYTFIANTGSGASNNAASFTNNADAGLNINLTSGVSLIDASTGILAFGTSNTERMRLTSAGLLGLGTSVPNYQLHVTTDFAVGASGFNQQLSFTNDTIQSLLLGTGYTALKLNPLGGNVGIGTTGPNAALDVRSATTWIGDGTTDAFLQFNQSATAANRWHIGAGSSNALIFYKGTYGSGSETARIDSSGRLLVGTSSSVGYGSLLQVVGGDTARPQIHRNVNDQYPPIIYFSKARGTASQSVSSGDELGQIAFVGYDGTGQVVAATINGLVDGTPGANDMPGRLVFSTTADGAASPTERLRIDSSGRVGIGTTSPNSVLQVNSGTNLGGILIGFNAGSSNFYDADLQVFRTGNGTERARIDSSGRLLVGTSNARSLFFAGGASALTQIEGNSTATASLSITRNDATADGNALVLAKARSTAYAIVQYVNGTTSDDRIGRISFQGADGTNMVPAASIEAYVDGTPGANDMPGRLVFSTTADGAASPTERMRIHANGFITYGTGALDSTGLTFGPTRSGTGSAPTLTWNGSFAGTTTACDFLYNGTRQGSITTTTSATAYNTTSDYRLKENIQPLTGAADRLNQLQVHRFNFIADPDHTVDGFIAHEAQAVVPECVTGDKDAVDDDGNSVYQGIDQSKLVPLLTAALQEAIAKIEALETRLSALEGA